MTFTEAIRNASGIGVMSGAEIEREYVAAVNAATNATCECGARFTYSAGVGAWRAACGAMETRSRVVRECGAR
jgi:hypothetical protein